MDLTGNQAIASKVRIVFSDYALTYRYPAMLAAIERAAADPASQFEIVKAGGAHQVVPQYAPNELYEILSVVQEVRNNREAWIKDEDLITSMRGVLSATSLFSSKQLADLTDGNLGKAKRDHLRLAGLPFSRIGGTLADDSIPFLMSALAQKMKEGELCAGCLFKAKKVGTGVAVISRLTGVKVNRINYMIKAGEGDSCSHDHTRNAGTTGSRNSGHSFGGTQAGNSTGRGYQTPRVNHTKPPLSHSEISGREADRHTDPSPVSGSDSSSTRWSLPGTDRHDASGSDSPWEREEEARRQLRALIEQANRDELAAKQRKDAAGI